MSISDRLRRFFSGKRRQEVAKGSARYEFAPVVHDLDNTALGQMLAQQAAETDKTILVEGSLYLGGFIPPEIRDRVHVMIEPATIFTSMGRSPLHLYIGGRAIQDAGRGPRRMFETIASDIDGGLQRRSALRIANELLYLRRRQPDTVVYNEPAAWLRTVWYEADLLLHYVIGQATFDLFGAFIYSDLDEPFVDLITRHANAVSAMTSDRCLLFAFDGTAAQEAETTAGAQYVAYRAVIETPGRFVGSPTAAELDQLRAAEAQMLSEVRGVNRSLLFGQKLGVRMADTPCVVFWQSLDERRIVTVSLAGCSDELSFVTAMKRLADAIGAVVAEGGDVLTSLTRNTAAISPAQPVDAPETVGDAVRRFLRENTPPERDRLFLEDIDSFTSVRQVAPADVLPLLGGNGYFDRSEDEVQRAIEAILAEPFYKKDWGGEVNDLYSSNLVVHGCRLSAAFLLKGNGLRRSEMRIGDCGKNGDQLLRLFQSPAMLFVVQFVGHVSEAVIADVQGKVRERRLSGKNGWFLILDGQDTARLLRAYGYA